jgi:hypothetical protein
LGDTRPLGSALPTAAVARAAPPAAQAGGQQAAQPAARGLSTCLPALVPSCTALVAAAPPQHPDGWPALPTDTPPFPLPAPFLQSHFKIHNTRGFRDISVVHPTGAAGREARTFVELGAARALRKVTLQVGADASLTAPHGPGTACLLAAEGGGRMGGQAVARSGTVCRAAPPRHEQRWGLCASPAKRRHPPS